MITHDQIQSIVDGECSDELRAVLLHEIESQPKMWRTLALALLEEQTWSKQISCFGKSKMAFHSLQTSPSSSLAAATLNGLSQSQPLLGLPNVELPTRISKDSSSSAFPWMSALAASLLFGLGVFGGSYLPNLTSLKSDRGDMSSIAVAKNQLGKKQVEPMGDPSVPHGNLDTDMKMLVSGPNKETAEIPIYDIKAMDHDVFVAKEMYEVARINQRLRKEGFELDVRPEYYTGKLNDGRQLIVPVRHVGFKPYGL